MLPEARYCALEVVAMIIDFAMAISYERGAIYGITTSNGVSLEIHISPIHNDISMEKYLVTILLTKVS